MEGESDLGEGAELHRQTPPLQRHKVGGQDRMPPDVEGEGGEHRRDLKEEVPHCPLEGGSSRSLVQGEGDQGGQVGEAERKKEGERELCKL